MTVLHQLLVTWAMNVLWQPMAIYAMACLACTAFARRRAHFQHRIWLAATVLGSTIPLATIWGLWGSQPTVTSNPSASIPPMLMNVIAAVVVPGVIFRLAAMIRNLHTTASLARDARPVCLIGVKPRGIEIRASWGENAQLGPFAVGFFRPIIVIPELFLLAEDGRAAQAAIAHELAHIERNDAWWLLASELFLTLLGFHPVSKAFRTKLSATREMACDERVVSRQIDSGDYAQALLEVARHTVRQTPVLYGMGAIGGCQLETRIRAIVALPPGGPRRLAPYQKAAALLWAVALTASMAWSARTLFLWMNPLPVLRRAVDSIPPPPPPPLPRPR
jgi:beta-lactamase regulating signal transducer with metallopeptidase domain